MKKTTLFLLAVLIIFTGCKKEDNPQTSNNNDNPAGHYALRLILALLAPQELSLSSRA